LNIAEDLHEIMQMNNVQSSAQVCHKCGHIANIFSKNIIFLDLED